MTMQRTDVTVLGAGLMGAAFARALLASGRSVTVWNRTPDRASALEEAGAQVAPTATAAMQASPLTFVIIKSYEAVHEILREASAAGGIGDVVNLVTGEPVEAESYASWVDDLGLEALDGAIMGFPGQVESGSGDFAIFLAGSEAAWGRSAALLQELAPGAIYLGAEMAMPNALDSMILSFLASAEVAALEAMDYGLALGLPLELVTQFLMAVPDSVTKFIQHAGDRLGTGDLSTTQASIDTWAASSSMAAEAARRLGLEEGQVAHAAATIRAKQKAGLGQLDLVALSAHLAKEGADGR
jgi:3-hydroxyisobutyrate dehydrogenase-like beta-hydroxyacid dehydrogenase